MILILWKVDPTLQPLFHYGWVYRTAHHPPAGLGCPEPRISWSQTTEVEDHGSRCVSKVSDLSNVGTLWLPSFQWWIHSLVGLPRWPSD